MVKNIFLNKKIFLVFLLILLIAITTFFILRITNTPNSTAINPDLKNYNILKEQLSALTEPDAPNAGQVTYSRILPQLNILENNKTSTNDKYKSLLEIASEIDRVYTATNDPKYPTFLKDVGEFAKENFPKNYNQKDFEYPCQDPTCATTQMPKEIQDVVDEINQSSLDQGVKDTYNQNLLNASYLPLKTASDINDAVLAYLNAASVIKRDGAFVAAGLNEKIYNEILNYLQKNYPNQLKELNQ